MTGPLAASFVSFRLEIDPLRPDDGTGVKETALPLSLAPFLEEP
jgi:hypothetical protein